MPNERIFTDEELRIKSLRSVDALKEALQVSDDEAAAGFAKRLRREATSMLQSYNGWETSLRATIVQLGGEAAEREALREIEDPTIAPERMDADPDTLDRWRETAREIETAIAAGNRDHALERGRTLHDKALELHDRGMSRIAAMLSWIGRHHGSPAVEDALERAMGGDLLGNASFRERAEALMHFTRVHLQPFELQEDDEKLTFICPICPSGGRLLREGHYAPPRDNLRIEGPQPLTYGRDELPVYCCHEPVMEKTSIEATGVPLFVVEPSERLGEDPCRTYLYKNPADIPERFYTRLGLEKPGR